MDKYEVEITKVFGLAVTKKVSVRAENIDEAIDEAKNTDWKPVYGSITPGNMSQSYDIAEISVDGKVIEDMFFASRLLREAIDLNKENYRSI